MMVQQDSLFGFIWSQNGTKKYTHGPTKVDFGRRKTEKKHIGVTFGGKQIQYSMPRVLCCVAQFRPNPVSRVVSRNVGD